MGLPLPVYLDNIPVIPFAMLNIKILLQPLELFSDLIGKLMYRYSQFGGRHHGFSTFGLIALRPNSAIGIPDPRNIGYRWNFDPSLHRIHNKQGFM